MGRQLTKVARRASPARGRSGARGGRSRRHATQHSPLLLLQGQIGNAAVSRLVREGGPMELQRACACGGACKDCREDSEESAHKTESVQRKPSSGEPTLRQGSRSPAVLELQQLLVAQGADIAPDGVFGPKTARAVKDFQRGAGLEADGIAGPKTWAALRGGTGELQAPPGHELLLTKLRAAFELLQGLKDQPAEPKKPPQPTPAETAGVGFLDEIADAAESAVDWVGDKASETSSWLEEKAEAATDWVEEKASEASSWVEDKVTEGAKWVEQTATDAGDAVVQAVDTTVGAVGGALSGIADDVRKRFGPELDALEKAVSELGKGFRGDIDFDAINRLLDIFVNGISAKNALATNEGPGENKLPEDCKISVEAQEKGGDLCPPGAVKETKPDGSPEDACGALYTYSYPRITVNGTCPISLDGAKLTETVTSDGAVSGKSGVRTGDCPIAVDGTIIDCEDTYGVCLPAKQVMSKIRGGHATETFTQQLFVQGTLVETHKIKFNFMREGPVCYVSSISRD